jgi:hypothetical protein
MGPVDFNEVNMAAMILQIGFVYRSRRTQTRLVDILQSPAAKSLVFFTAAQQVPANSPDRAYFTRRALEHLGFRVVYQI